MDRNTIIGLLLIGAILVVFSIYNQPSAEQLAEQQRVRDSIELAMPDTVHEAIKPVETPAEETLLAVSTDTTLIDSTQLATASQELQGKFGLFAPSAEGEEAVYKISSDLLELEIDARGGIIRSAILSEYKTHDSLPLQLMDPEKSGYYLSFAQGNKYINSQDLYFEPQGSEFHVSGDDNKEFVVRMRTNDPDKYIDYRYGLKGNSYQVDFNIDIVGLENEIQFRSLELNWHLTGFSNEKALDVERQKSTVYYKFFNDERDYLSEGSDDEEQLFGKTNWVAFKQNFFSAVLVSPVGFADGSEIKITPLEDETHTKLYEANLLFTEGASSRVNLPMKFYLGPNHYQTLKNSGIEDLDRVIDLGWTIFGAMNKWVVIPIFNWLESYGLSYGLIILILTIIIKMALFPLTYKNYKSSAKMRVLKPEIEEITEKFKDGDAMKKQQATMALYKKAGVNPMSGCVPMLIQMPILYAMFRFFPSSIELRQQSFLWADDLSSYDSIFSWTEQIPLISSIYGNHISLFTLLMAVSTMLYTRMNSSQMPSAGPGMPNMKMMMYLFPIMMIFIFNNFSSGLSYYYLTANIISMLQMTVIKKYIIDEDKIHAQIQANKAKPKKQSNFQKRLEQMAKERSQPQGKKKKKR